MAVLVSGIVNSRIRQLHARLSRTAAGNGTHSLQIRRYLRYLCVDEYRIWVFPLVLGEGKRLFENGVPPGGLALVETRSTPKGVLINTYRPAGSLPQGTLHPDNPSDAELARRKKLAAEGSAI